MPHNNWLKLVRKFACAGIGGAVVLSTGSGVALASYGPLSSPVSSPPGGFYCVVTSQTVRPVGGLIGPFRLGKLRATIRIPRRAFSFRVQITVTEPYGSQSCEGGSPIGNGGFRGYSSLGGVGILVQRHGTTYRARFRRGVVIGMSSPSISRSSVVAAWTRSRFTRKAATAGPRSETVRAYGNTDLAVFTPVRHRRGHGSAVTTAVPALPGLLTAAEFLAAAWLCPAGSPVSAC